MATRFTIQPWVSARSPLELAALAALPVIPMNAGPAQVAALADRRGCTPQAIYQEIVDGDLIAWTVDDQWVCVGCAEDDYGVTLILDNLADLPLAA